MKTDNGPSGLARVVRGRDAWPRWSSTRRAICVIAFLSITTNAPASTAIYQTGFEPPAYSVGTLAGKDGWFGATGTTVQNAIVKSGTQAAAIAASGLTGSSISNHSISYSLSGNSEPIVRMSVDMFLTTAGNPSGAWDAFVAYGSGGFLTQLFVSGSTASLGLASSSVGSVPAPRGVWNTYVLELNHRTRMVSAYVNGTLIGSGPFANPTTVSEVAFGVLQNPGTDTAYFDNLIVTSERDTTAPFTFTRFAGGVGGPGSNDGTASVARLGYPEAVTVDAAGNVYVMDTSNHTIRKITPQGAVTTVAGLAGHPGAADGIGSLARFNSARGIAVGPDGTLYVADTGNAIIRRITPGGRVTTFAGTSGSRGNDDGTGTRARFNFPWGITVDRFGNLYVTDTASSTVRRITPEQIVTTVAGTAGQSGSADGSGNAARFLSPRGVAATNDGSIYVADTDNHTIRLITPSGVVTTAAGLAGTRGQTNGPAGTSRFDLPIGVAVSGSGAVFVTSLNGPGVRTIISGNVAALSGSGSSGYVDGVAGTARFDIPSGIAVDSTGTSFVADSSNSAIRRVSSNGSVTTYAGRGGESGNRDGVLTEALFKKPEGLAFDSIGNLYVADSGNHCIRRITPSGEVSTFAGACGTSGAANGAGSSARFSFPKAIASDGSNLYVSDWLNFTVRKITSVGVVTTIAGTAGQLGSSDGQGASARFYFAQGIAVDSSGTVYVADTQNHTIRKITPTGAVTTLAGVAGASGTADGSTSARFDRPLGLAVGADGALYVADSNNSTIRRVTATGTVTTFAGAAREPGSTDGTGSQARLEIPSTLAFDADGNLFVGEGEGRVVRKISPSGVVTTVAGSSGVGGNDDGTGPFAHFDGPAGLAIDNQGRLYVTSTRTHTIVRGDGMSLPDLASIDAPAGLKGATRLLSSSYDTATSWQWSVIRRPVDSIAELSSTLVRSPTFTPDQLGLFTFRLIASRDNYTSITTVDLFVPDGSRRRAATGEISQRDALSRLRP